MMDKDKDFSEPKDKDFSEPVDYLAWEEKQRLLAFKERGLAKAPPEGYPVLYRYTWLDGVSVDVTCLGCGSSGCNRCRGKDRTGFVRTERDPTNATSGGWYARIRHFMESLWLSRRNGVAQE